MDRYNKYAIFSGSLTRYFILAFWMLFFLLPTKGFSQQHEFGVFGGVTNYFGDLNTKASFKYVRQGAGVFYRYSLKYRWAWRTSITYGEAEFYDRANSDAWNQQRNLSFRSNIYDVSSLMEFNFFKFDKESKRDWWTPYIGVGLSLFFYNPQAEYDGVWYYLQPLGTEGQNNPSYSGVKKYKPYSFAIPLECGFKFSVARNWNVGIEGGLRETFTKYLDDVSGQYPAYVNLPGGTGGLAAALSNRSGSSAVVPGLQRGDGKDDQYLFLGFTASYVLMTPRCPTPAGRHRYGW